MTPAGNGSQNGRARGESWPASGVGSPVRTQPRSEAVPRRVLATIGFVLDATRRRRSGRIALWTLVVAMALSGVALIAQPLVTDVVAGRRQSSLEEEFRAQTPEQASAAYKEKAVKPGDPLTRLVIPRLRVNKIVVEGITGNALRAGLGHYPNSELPGSSTGNVAIAGHRTGFGEPFRHLDRLDEGDRIELVTPFGTYVYEVMGEVDGHANPWITHDKDWSVVQATPYPALTLTTCDPPGTSKNRLILRARLVGSQPAQ